MGRCYKWDMQQNQNIENILKDRAFFHLQKNVVINIVNNEWCCNKTGIETVSKRVV